MDGYDGAYGDVVLNYSFEPETVYRLTVSILGGGTVQLVTTNDLFDQGGITILPGESGDFVSGSVVTNIPVPDANSQFRAWSGDVSSTDNPLVVVMTGDMNITANFTNKAFTDGFESGSLTNNNLLWTNAGTSGWFVQTNIVAVGRYAIQSGAIGDNQSSSLILRTNFGVGTISFDYKVSSETNWDFLQFYVDTNLIQQWSGEAGWATYTFSLTNVGPHTLEWRYVKDASVSDGLDAAFIDDIHLPIPGFIDHLLPRQSEFPELTGQAGQKYVVQTSTDMKNWQNISTNFADTDGVIYVLLPSNRTNQAQFYRAIAP